MLFFLLLFLLFMNTIQTAQKAVTIVPVADLIGNPASKRETSKYYQQLPICGNNSLADLRIHQLLFHEIVTIEEENGAEVRIKVPNVFYQTKKGAVCTHYWSLKKNFVPLQKLKNNKNDLKKIPEPIKFDTDSLSNSSSQEIVTLRSPFYSKKFHMTFSAGTRFVICKVLDKEYSVYAINPSLIKTDTIKIPKSICIEIPQNKKNRRELFISLVKEWAHCSEGFIPYVWGGCSFTQLCKIDQFTHKNNSNFIYYERPTLPKPYGGFDCSSFIWRCAQMSGIPLYCKNSFTFAQQLKSLDKNEKIKEGDIIWFPGHVMLISNIKNYLITEARSYNHGYGKIHELPISEIFKDIKTFDELINAYYDEKPLYRMNKEGTVVQTIPTFKILKLESVWSKS